MSSGEGRFRRCQEKMSRLTVWGGQALTPPKPLNVIFFLDPPPRPLNVTSSDPHKNQPLTRISPSQESALHKNQPYRRISPTQESAQHKNQILTRISIAGFKKKVGGAAGATVAPQAPPASGASSVRPGDTHRSQSARTVEPRSTVWGGSHFFV